MFRTHGQFRCGDRTVRTAFTARHAGGASRAPYDDLNLGGQVGDDPAAVSANRAAVAGALGVDRVVWMTQVHGTAVGVVDAPPPDADLPAVDALVTTQPAVALGVLVADCVPVLLTSADGGVAAVHAGRRGVQGQVVLQALQALERLDGSPVVALVGPAICGACYEVPAAMQEQVCDVVPQARSTTRRGTSGLDLRAAVAAQLAQRDVRVRVLGGGGSALCTAEDGELFSYRRDETTGRFAGLVVTFPA